MAENKRPSQRRYVGVKESTIYGIANGGQTMSYNLVNGQLNYFFVNVFHIDSAIVGLVFLIEGIWDVINDPLMGTLIDRTRTRWGKMRPYMRTVPIPLGIMTILMLAGPMLVSSTGAKAPTKIIYFIATYFLWEFFYTIGDVAFWGTSAAISPNPKDRSSAISSARFISSIVGALPTLALPFLIDMAKEPDSTVNLKQVFLLIGLVAGTIGMALFSMVGFLVKERTAQAANEPTFRDCINCIAKNPPLQKLFLKEAIGAFKGVADTYSTYFFLDVLGQASLSVIVGIPSVIMQFVSYLFLPAMLRKLDERKLTIFTRVAQAAVFGVTYLIAFRQYDNLKLMIPLIMVKQVLENVFYASNMVLPPQMIGDTVDYMEWTTGQRSEGVSFSLLTMISKLTGAASRSVGALLLKPIGYQTSASGQPVQQTQKTKQGIWFIYMAFPAIMLLLSAIPMFFYDLVGDKRARMLKDLEARREKLSQEAAQDAAAGKES